MKAVILALFAVAALSLAHSNSYYKAQFGAYVSMFNKNYSEQEFRYRLDVFSQNLDYIHAENEKGHSYTLGFTPFVDMTHDEFKASRSCGCLMKNNLRGPRNIVNLKTDDLPESIDWREKGAVNAVKNQEACGSCWAFSAVASMEGVVAVKTGTLYSLSEQQLVDCDKKCAGCNGGLMTNAFSYSMKNKGLCTEEAYPYTAKVGTCVATECTAVAPITNYAEIDSKWGKQLLAAIAEHPISVAIEADSYAFQYYTSGVLDTDACGTDLNHGVAAVGYGVEDGKKYILIRNSWGEKWGLDGYIKLAHVDFGEGVCGVNMDASYPIV